MTYEINWDDGDPSGRVQPTYLIALNRVPNHDEVHVGQKVFFPQGMTVQHIVYVTLFQS